MTILSRHLTPDASSTVDPRVRAVLDAGATTATDVATAGEAAALAAFHTASGRRFHAVSLRAAALATAAFGVVAIGGGAAAAATGSLPGSAQDTARSMLAKVGISVPGSDDHAGTNPDSRGASDNAPANEGNNGKGSQISQIATDPSTTGLDKGVAVSTAASGGKSQAGQHGGSTDANPPSTGDKSGDAADGATTANSASRGRSSAGSANAGTHLTR